MDSEKVFFGSTNFHFFGGQKDLFLEAWSDFQEWGCPAKLLEIALGKYEAGLSEIQCVQSSLSQNGGADLRPPCSGKFLKALK